MNRQGNKIKAVIFDIDGTLIDSNDAHAASFVAAFKEFGKIVPFVELKWLIGMGADKILEKYLTKTEIARFGEDLTEYRKKIFLRDYFPKLKTFPQLRPLFEKIKRDGKKIALASSASDEELEKYHELLRIDDLLDKETSSDDAEESKPEPDIFLAALGKLKNVGKREVLVIGDTPYDVEAAAKAKLEIIGVQSGGWSRERLLAKGCREAYENIGELYKKYETVFPGEDSTR
jgi:HAD superfamily hydrolase (TIGR01549 family)